MTAVRFCLVFLLLLVATAGATPERQARLRADVEMLGAPALAGRGSGTPEVEAAADSLAVRYARWGLQPAFNGEWFQTFPLKGEGWTGEDLTGRSGRNLAGMLPGAGPLAERWIVVGAHYDHLGRLEPVAGVAPAPAEGQYYPGANDNASGVAILLQMMREARQATGERRSVLFVNFSGEEVGLQGSAYFVNHLPVPAASIDLMINLDTVGHRQTGKLYVSGVGTAQQLPRLIEAANGPETGSQLELSLAQGGWSGSDHLSFNKREIPVLFLFGGPYAEYNTPRDTADRLDYEAMDGITGFALKLLDAARRQPGTFAWQMVAEKKLTEDTSEPGNRSTWFGSLPDFNEEIEGYALAGVFDGSPAARAGLLKGDVLVLFAGRTITDLPTFTRALRAHDPGDLVEVTVLRDGGRLNFTVALGDRSEKE